MSSTATFTMIDDCVNGNLNSVKNALVNGLDPNYAYAGKTALLIACEQGDEDLAAIVLSYKGDPDRRSGLREKTPRETCEEIIKDDTFPKKVRQGCETIILMMDADEMVAAAAKEACTESILRRVNEECKRDLQRSFSIMLITLLIGAFVYIWTKYLDPGDGVGHLSDL
mmetsp:Transcript_16360/g.49230  ORF Transcript_16360/g.49230 Transcript_16360/m.49230 type:complete len:169 (+) Transcript_16360:68-574(+)